MPSANAKQFPINTASTTSSAFQIDSANNGPKFKNVSGEVQIRDSGDSADAPTKASKLTLSGQDFCSVYKTGTQAIGAGAEVLIAFDTATNNTGFFNTSTSTATIATAGTYLITAFARLDGLADGKATVLDIRINDTRVAMSQLSIGASGNLCPPLTWMAQLAVSNTIKVYLTNGDSSERSMQAGSQNNGLAIVRLF